MSSRNPTSVATAPMNPYPFPLSELTSYRCQTTITGTLAIDDETKRLILRSLYGTLRIYNPKRQSSALWAAIKHAKNHDYNVVHAYGYPAISKSGQLYGLQLVAFNDAAIEADNHLLVPVLDNGIVWLCGRVRSLQDGLATVRVKTKLHNRPQFWDVRGIVADNASVVVGSKSLFRGHIEPNGHLMLSMDQLVKAPRPLRPASPSRRPSTSQTRQSVRRSPERKPRS